MYLWRARDLCLQILFVSFLFLGQFTKAGKGSWSSIKIFGMKNSQNSCILQILSRNSLRIAHTA